jgi:hypothetical protein
VKIVRNMPFRNYSVHYEACFTADARFTGVDETELMLKFINRVIGLLGTAKKLLGHLTISWEK